MTPAEQPGEGAAAVAAAAVAAAAVAAVAVAADAGPAGEAAGRFLLCRVGDARRALPLDAVAAVVRPDAVSPVPLAPPAVIGLANHRGTVCTVLALAALTGDAAPAAAAGQGQLVLLKEARLGLLIDGVLGIGDEADGLVDLDALLARHLAHAWTGWRGARRAAAEPLAAPAAAAAVERTELLVFALDGAEYALPLDELDEVAWAPEPAGGEVAGTVRLRRGEVAQIDLRARWRLPGPPPARAALMVTRAGEGDALALRVDRLREVIAPPRAAIRPPPALIGGAGRLDEIVGLWRDETTQRLVSIVSPQRLRGGLGAPGLQAPGAAEPVGAAAEEILPTERPSAVEPAAPAGTGGEVLLVQADAVELALPLQAVQALVRLPEQLLRPPGLPEHVAGVMNWRGQAVGVLDLRQRLELPAAAPQLRQRVVLVAHGGVLHGLLVDAAREVLAVPAAAWREAPALSARQAALLPRLLELDAGRRLVQGLDLAALLGGAAAASGWAPR